jgi:hypothetical protein
MFSRLFGGKKPYKEVQNAASGIHLLGEPTGDGVAALKAQLAAVLAAEGNVSRAFLSRVRYGGGEQVRLALVVDGRAPQQQMAEAIAAGCQAIVAIDILFLESLAAPAVEQLEASLPFFPAEAKNKLFLINAQVGRGSNPGMPHNLSGAYVPVFVGAPDADAAARAAVRHLAAQGFEFLDVADKKIHQLDPQSWQSYLEEAWAGFASHFPSQEVVLAGLPYGQVFFGPFAGYESKNA